MNRHFAPPTLMEPEPLRPLTPSSGTHQPFPAPTPQVNLNTAAA